jgi:hypothetical protein
LFFRSPMSSSSHFLVKCGGHVKVPERLRPGGKERTAFLFGKDLFRSYPTYLLGNSEMRPLWILLWHQKGCHKWWMNLLQPNKKARARGKSVTLELWCTGKPIKF